MPRPDENHEATMTARSDFTAGWSLRLADPADQSVPEPVRSALPIPATVPGTVHTDLLAAGLIPDPYLDENEAALTWIGHADWVYEREYEHDLVDGEHVVLAFDGLDTVATVTVNDVVVARTENMHRRYEVPIEHALRDGVNAVAVRFDSAWSFGEAERARIGDLPNAYPGTPSTSCASRRATSAGTGAPRSSPPASGATSRSCATRAPASDRCDRRSPSRRARVAPTSSSSSIGSWPTRSSSRRPSATRTPRVVSSRGTSRCR